MARGWRLTALFVVLCGVILVNGGCQRTVEVSDVAITDVPSAKPVVMATSTATPSAVNPPSSDTFTLTSIGEELASIPGYTLVVSWSFEGTRADGTPSSWQLDTVEKASTVPVGSSLEMAIKGSADLSGVEALTIVQLDGAGYLYIPNLGCMTRAGERLIATTIEPGNPDTWLAGLTGAELVSTKEVVEGKTNRLYRFDESALPALSGQPLKAEGELLVAQPEGYVSRISVVINGQGDFLSRGIYETGSLRLVVNVKNVSPTQEIEPPEACLTATPYPMLDDAYQITSLSDLVSYESKKTLADAITFYKEEMAQAGWTIIEDITEFEDVAFLTFMRDGNSVTINIELLETQPGVAVFISP